MALLCSFTLLSTFCGVFLEEWETDLKVDVMLFFGGGNGIYELPASQQVVKGGGLKP